MTGLQLRDERKARRLTLEGLGELLGVTRQRVYQLEQRDQLTGPEEASVRHALAGFDGTERPRARPIPFDCPICAHPCDTGPAMPGYVLSEHLRAMHVDRFGLVRPPSDVLGAIPSNLRGYRLRAGDPGIGPVVDPALLVVIFGDYPYVIFPLPTDGRTAYQWIPGSVPEGGRTA